MKYTVIMQDRSEHYMTIGTTRILIEEGDSAYDAAQYAEITLATEVFTKRHGEGIDPKGHGGGYDDEWIACMESVGVVAVIEGTPTTYFEDSIYDPSITDYIVNQEVT